MRRLGGVLAAALICLSAAAPAQTYEEIMSQIAEYPGPDEPLYFPTEDEAIWLTDLEGHADIYDNDLIRINYAKWFDKNQITKIVAYRNDIKMRFLTDKFDVLTNEQMKTFDGNSLERSPASSHTDHAILGYYYEFHFETASENLPSTRKQIRNSVQFTGEVFAYIEQNWPYETPSMSDQALRGQFAKLGSLGFAGIEIDTYYYMGTDTATSLFAKPDYDPKVHWTSTPSESELRRILRLAHESGLKTWLRIQVQLSEASKNSIQHFAWRGSIQPTSVSSWFKSYGRIVLGLAELAESEGVDILGLGVELASL